MAGKEIEVEHSWAADQWDWPLQHNDGIVKLINTPDKFQVALEMVYFTPKEIEVKVIGEQLCVHCRHEERSDAHGTVSREVNRNYEIPHDVDKSTLKSELNAAGILVITAQKKK